MKYEALDAAILEHVKGTNAPTVSPINSRELQALADQISTEEEEVWRIIDRRLQALRKAGKITWTRSNGWRLA